MTQSQNGVVWWYIGASVGCVVCIIIIILVIRMTRKKQPANQVIHQTHHNSSSTYVVPEGQSMTVPQTTDFLHRQPIYKNRDKPEYLVPYSALPRDFDFSTRDIRVFGDYVILHDLRLLDTSQNDERSPNMEAYQIQQPYNPDFHPRY